MSPIDITDANFETEVLNSPVLVVKDGALVDRTAGVLPKAALRERVERML